MTQYATRAEFKAAKDAALVDNTTGAIDPGVHRQVEDDLADSALFPEDIPSYGFEGQAELGLRDEQNRDRANHTGTQAISTVTGLTEALVKVLVSDASNITVVSAGEVTNLVTMTSAAAAVYEASAEYDPTVLIATRD